LYGTYKPVLFYWLNEGDQDKYGKFSIFSAIETHLYKNVVENFLKALGKNIIEDVGIVDHTEL
jgi:hypothetical protein